MADSTEFSDSRITASRTPPMPPISMAMNVSSIVTATARSVSGLNRYSQTTGQSTVGFLTNE